jgi:hypothetical protein
MMDSKKKQHLYLLRGLMGLAAALAAAGAFILTDAGQIFGVSKRLVIAHIPEYDVIVAFDRMKDQQELTVTEVDFFGQTKEHGMLDRAFIFNGPMWAVWVHYYPQTKVMK